MTAPTSSRRITPLICAIFALFLYLSVNSSVQSVLAVQKSSIRVSPAFVEIDTSQTNNADQITIDYTNTNAQQVHIGLSFLPVTFVGDPNAIRFPITKSILSSHVIPSSNEFDILAGETKTIVLSLVDLNLLADADYYEALVAKVSSDSVSTTSSSGIVGNITTLLFVRNSKSGRIPRYTVKTGTHILPRVLFSYPQQIDLSIENRGDTYGIPRGLVTMTDMAGRTVRRGAINEDSVRIFPRSSRTMNVKLVGDEVLLPAHVGFLRVDMRDQYSAHVEATLKQQIMFVYIDPLFGIPLLIVVLLCMISLVYGKTKNRHRNKHNPTFAPIR